MKVRRILLDECIDRRLASYIPDHLVQTVYQAGFAGLKNGKLLTEAQKQFDVFVTVDRNLTSQQNLASFDIAVIVLKSHSNRIEDLKLLSPLLLTALGSAKSHCVTFVGIDG